MPLTFDQMKKLYLGCTVHFPPVFPELGEIRIDEKGIVLGSGRNVATLSVADSKATRTVLLSEVSALFIPHNDKNDISFDHGEWMFGADVQDKDLAAANLTQARKQAKTKGNDSGKGLAFIREGVSVITELEQEINGDRFLFGGPAAESFSIMDCCP